MVPATVKVPPDVVLLAVNVAKLKVHPEVMLRSPAILILLVTGLQVSATPPPTVKFGIT